MRAYAIDEFGGPASIREVPDPEVGDDEILVRVSWAGLSTTDLAILGGVFTAYLPHVFPVIPGIDASGIVERVGPNAARFRVGDAVYGFQAAPVMGRGTLAEKVSIPARGLQPKPDSLSFEQAAVIAHSALTAVAAIRTAQASRGQDIVLLGATGGVGSYATQLLKAAGVNVVAVTQGDYAEYARSLGAAEVIDYTAVDAVGVTRSSHADGLDAVIDLAGVPELLTGMADLVKSGGQVVSVVLPPDIDGLALRGVTGTLATRYAGESSFDDIAGQVASGALRIPALQTFPFADTGAALDLQATRHVHGKLAVHIR